MAGLEFEFIHNPWGDGHLVVLLPFTHTYGTSRGVWLVVDNEYLFPINGTAAEIAAGDGFLRDAPTHIRDASGIPASNPAVFEYLGIAREPEPVRTPTRHVPTVTPEPSFNDVLYYPPQSPTRHECSLLIIALELAFEAAERSGYAVGTYENFAMAAAALTHGYSDRWTVEYIASLYEKCGW